MIATSSASSDLDRQMSVLRHGDHLCTIDNSSSEQLAVAVSFLRHGLAAGDCCLCLAAEPHIAEFTAALEQAGVDVTAATARGALQWQSKQDAWLRAGRFDPHALIDLLRTLTDDACRRGFAGLRVMSDMAWVLGDQDPGDALLEYESLLNSLVRHSPLAVVCQYDGQLSSPFVLRGALRTHPRAVLGGQVCENLYYEPEPILRGEQEARRVQWMIDQLQGRQQEVAQRQHVEDALRLSEQRFARFMQCLPGLAWIKDDAGRYVYANDPAHRAFQTQAETLYGKTDPEVFDAATAQRFMENDQQAIRSDSTGVQVVETLEHPDGTLHHSLVTKFSIPDGQGPTLVGGMAIDITSQKQAEKTARDMERVYRAIGESIDYGVWICDREGKNVYLSETFLRLTGLTQEQCSNYRWIDALHPHDQQRTVHAWKEFVRTTGTWDCELRVRGMDGAYHSILSRGVPVRDERGEVIYWAGINLDISRLKYAEDLLRTADRRKDEFLAMLAHELRNPLAPIRSGLDLLALGEQSPEVIDIMQHQVEHLVRLVDDLLDVSRIMRGKVELRKEPVELAAIVARAIETTRPLIDAQHHQLTRSLPPAAVWLNADPVRLAQIIANLLNNAAKYTNPGGQIWLTAETHDADVLIHVKDNGIGIDAALLPRVFDLFTQAQQTIDRSQGGLGIGLTVVKSLVEMHDGTISVRSGGLNQGTDFCIRLPTLSRSEAPLLRHQQTAPVEARRILIVDDNVEAARMLALLLAKMGGHEVRVAHDGHSALETGADFEPHLVLLDIGLPGMTGYEVATRMREHPTLSRALLVALTGYGTNEDRRKSHAAGFHEHLVKPPTFESLQRLLEHPRLGEVR